jgi:hypothetical protein
LLGLLNHFLPDELLGPNLAMGPLDWGDVSAVSVPFGDHEEGRISIPFGFDSDDLTAVKS